MMHTLDEILNDLYKDEINITLSSFWDNGWRIDVQTIHSPLCLVASHIQNLNDVTDLLIKAAIKGNPDSEFAKKYG